ncbi:MAG: protein-L-isoaspartate O-methyltransferase, partial [Pseudomonadota bacterium]
AILVAADYTAGYADQAPYNAILINGAVSACPQGIVDQLADAGRLACVVRDERSMGRITLVQRVRGVTSELELYDAGTPILPGFEMRREFEF